MDVAVTAVSSSLALGNCIDYIRRFWHSENEPEKVLVTGATGEIGYAIVPLIARGLMLGPDQPVILHMLDKDAEALEEVKMELIDAAFPLLKGVVATTKDEEAWKGVQVAVMIVGLPRTEGMNSEDASIYEDQALALGKHADKDCKVLVVPNPANAKALKLEEYEGPIPKENITYLTRLEHNRALGQIAEVAKVPVSDVKNVIIRGENYSTRCPDVKYAIVTTPNGEKSVKDYVANDHLLKLKLNTTVQHNARKRSSALSTASSACDHVHDWLLGTPKGTWVSMGVYSNGSYGSFPVTCDGTGKWFIKSLGAVSDKTTEKRIVDKRKTKALART